MGYAQDLVSKGYGGYAGWGDREAEADFKATGGSGKYSGGSSGGSGDLNSYFEQQNKLQQQAIQPAIQSLQASIPNIQKSYSTQISQKQADIAPLQNRYKSLIDQIKGQGKVMADKQTVVTAGELGKRGIEGSSTLAGQAITDATRPIEQSTQSLTQQTGLAQEADIKAIQDAITNLSNQQNLDVGNVNTAIANLQAGGGQSAITQAMQLLANQQAKEAAIASTNKEMSKGQIETIGGNKYLVNPYTGAKTLLGAAESGSGLSDLFKGFITPEPKPTTIPKPGDNNFVGPLPKDFTPDTKTNVLGQNVLNMGPQDLINQQTPQLQTNWWDKLFGNNFASSQLRL